MHSKERQSRFLYIYFSTPQLGTKMRSSWPRLTLSEDFWDSTLTPTTNPVLLPSSVASSTPARMGIALHRYRFVFYSFFFQCLITSSGLFHFPSFSRSRDCCVFQTLCTTLRSSYSMSTDQGWCRSVNTFLLSIYFVLNSFIQRWFWYQTTLQMSWSKQRWTSKFPLTSMGNLFASTSAKKKHAMCPIRNSANFYTYCTTSAAAVDEYLVNFLFISCRTFTKNMLKLLSNCTILKERVSSLPWTSTTFFAASKVISLHLTSKLTWSR